MRRHVLLAALLFSVLLVGGCGLRPGQPVFVFGLPGATDSTQTLPGGGLRVTKLRGGLLRLSAEVASTSVVATQGVTVRVVLTNVGKTQVHWDALDLGWRATRPGDPTGRTIMAAGVNANDQAEPVGPSVTLAPGDSTSTVASSGGIPAGTYGIRGEYDGVGGVLNGDQTNEVTIRVKAP